jgi:hypothetical protein
MAGLSNGANLNAPIKTRWEKNLKILKSIWSMWIQISVMDVESVHGSVRGMSSRYHLRLIQCGLKTVLGVKPVSLSARRMLLF